MKWASVSAGRVLLLALIPLLGCSGPEGPAGAQGTSGPQGAMGTSGPGGASVDGGDGGQAIVGDIPVGCLSPCHGFNGVVTQFQTSVHYTEYLVNVSSATPETEWTTPGAACGNCHAIDALQQRVTGNVGTSGDAGVLNLASGMLEYRNSANGTLSSANYTGSATVAEVYCTTCHAVTDANDPHKTGIPWTPGSFPLQVSGDNGAVFVEKSPTTAAVTGTDAGFYGPGDTCMFCHRSRVDVTNYLAPTNAITSVRWGPHEGPQADLFTGAGGYHFAGQTYGESTHEQKLSCIDCHMASVADNSNVADHSMIPKIAACNNCHAGATNFNINGFQSQIQAAMTQIEGYFNGQGLLTRAAAAPYTPLADPADAQAAAPQGVVGDGNWGSDQPVPGGMINGALMTRDQAGALYDYILVARGGASGVHNPKYIAQLLYDSYFALTNLPLAAFPARPQ